MRSTWPERVASDLPAEFALIARHFRPLAGPGSLDLQDDAAVLAPPPGRELVLTADAMVAGVHFLPEDPPDLVGRKLLRVNLSDLAAKGATPLGYLMTVSTPRDTPEAWFVGFVSGLADDQRTYGITLRYNPVLELGGFSIRISDFNWGGGTDPFSEVKPVVNGVQQSY